MYKGNFKRKNRNKSKNIEGVTLITLVVTIQNLQLK